MVAVAVTVTVTVMGSENITMTLKTVTPISAPTWSDAQQRMAK
jgi:hypothetical protein